jgi:hypothetical protein
MPARELDMSNAAEIDEGRAHWLEIYREAKAEEARQKKIKEDALAELKDGFRNETGLYKGRPVFQYIRGSQKRLDFDLLRELHPEAYEECRVDRPHEALYLVGDKDK